MPPRRSKVAESSVEKSTPRVHRVFQPVNWYECMPEEYRAAIRTYASYEDMKIEIPFRALLLGNSGSGKSNILLNIIFGLNCFSRIFIINRSGDEPLYNFLGGMCKDIEKKYKAKEGTILTLVKSIHELPSLDYFKKHKTSKKGEDSNTLFIFDDFVGLPEHELDQMDKICTTYRKGEVSCIFLGQSYTKIPPTVRKNSEYIFIKKVPLQSELNMILRQYPLLYTKEQLKAFYDKCDCHTLHNFMLIDLKPPEPCYQLRRNFEPSAVN